MKPYTKQSLNLLHKGTIALAEVEAHGLCMDVDYLDRTIKKVKHKITELKKDIQESKVVKIWKKKYKAKTNLASTTQLGDILFTEMKYKAQFFTASGRPKTDEKALGLVDNPFVKKYLYIKKLDKALSTYLKGIRREVVNGLLHPSFNLNFVSTYRSSSQNPNFQNIPIRDEKIGKLIRTAFIAREGNHLVEIDYTGMEVRAAACYHKDPEMMIEISDPNKDMHRDMAMQCYLLDMDQVDKKIRYCGKNMFVFPQFYGDWYIDCAKHLWEAIPTMHLQTKEGVPLQKHLRSKGIRELGDLNPKEKPRSGTFEKHIQKVEQNFWNVRFPVYSKWKKSWYNKYIDRGWFKTKTGFICQGYMKRNEVINYPVQGSAFHCLLWALITLQQEIKRRHMKTLIVGQIHDSIVADVPHKELDDYLALANYAMTEKLRKKWKWITVPLEIEAEVVPLGKSWFDKKEVELC